jgi:hypothetical protein
LSYNKLGSQSYHIYDTYFAEYNSNYSEINNYLFENKKYDIVRIFEKNDSKGSFKKLIIAKDYGIIGLIDIHDNIWSLKSNSKNKNTKQEKITINYDSC